MANFLYIVFPDIQRSSMDGCIYYCNYPDIEEIKKFDVESKRLLLLFNAEKDIFVFYCKAALLDYLKELAANNDYYPNGVLISLKKRLLDMGGLDYRQSKHYKPDSSFCTRGMSTIGDIVATAAQAVIDLGAAASSVLLVDANALQFHSRPTISYTTLDNNSNAHELHCSDFSVAAVVEYLIKYRNPPRDFFLSGKHRENMPLCANLGNASPLLGSRERAKFLSKYAFSTRSKRVWAYDWEHRLFITYMWQTENVWHAFHLRTEEEVREQNIPYWLGDLLMEISPRPTVVS